MLGHYTRKGKQIWGFSQAPRRLEGCGPLTRELDDMGKGSGRVALVVIAWGGSDWGALRGAVLVALGGSDEHLAEGGAASSGGDGRI